MNYKFINNEIAFHNLTHVIIGEYEAITQNEFDSIRESLIEALKPDILFELESDDSDITAGYDDSIHPIFSLFVNFDSRNKSKILKRLVKNLPILKSKACIGLEDESSNFRCLITQNEVYIFTYNPISFLKYRLPLILLPIYLYKNLTYLSILFIHNLTAKLLSPKCPKCNASLASENAKQCFKCGADWH